MRATALALMLAVLLVTSFAFFGSAQVEQATALENVRKDRDLFRSQVEILTKTVLVNTKQAECRSRLTNAVQSVQNERDSKGWQALVDIVVARDPGDRTARANEISALNHRLAELNDLRSRSVAICNENPDFVAPDPSKENP